MRWHQQRVVRVWKFFENAMGLGGRDFGELRYDDGSTALHALASELGGFYENGECATWLDNGSFGARFETDISSQ
jgi:hypothetical protein